MTKSFILVLLLASFGCQMCSAQKANKPNKSADKLVQRDDPAALPQSGFKLDSVVAAALPDSIKAIITKPDSVSAIAFDEGKTSDSAMVFKLKELERKNKIATKTATKFGKWVANKKNYYIGPLAKRCEFWPSYAIVYYKGGKKAYVFVATSCDMVRFGNPQKYNIATLETDPGHAEAVLIAKTIFPRIANKFK